MKPLDTEKNLLFMNDPRRVKAQEELNDIVRRIGTNVKSEGSAQYYLTTLPQLLKELETAYQSLTVIEATILSELEEKQ